MRNILGVAQLGRVLRLGRSCRRFESCHLDVLVEDIPQEIIDFLDQRAGKKHSRDGIVLETLAEILTIYDFLKELKIDE